MPGFKYNFLKGAGYYSIESFENTGKVRTCFSSRIGGVSEGMYNSLNLGYKSGDKKTDIDKNMNILCDAAEFNINDLVLSDQNHGSNCKIVNSGDRGKGIIIESDILGVDALVTNCRNLALCIFTADCVPVFLLDTENDVIALCHAGWRGIVGNIIPKTIDTMRRNFNTKPEKLLAAIAPSIGPCCFNVGTDVIKEFQNLFGDGENIIINENGNYKINLWNAAKEQLVKAGIESDIVNSEMCTFCNEKEFYSYRRDGKSTGRMVSIIQLI